MTKVSSPTPPGSPEAVCAQACTGWRVPPGDPEALAQALAHALSLGETARESLARRARAHVQSHFSLERMCDETLGVYAGMIEAGPRG
jgi:glycosyltransferase involved in cell wall biosynthesis